MHFFNVRTKNPLRHMQDNYLTAFLHQYNEDTWKSQRTHHPLFMDKVLTKENPQLHNVRSIVCLIFCFKFKNYNN